MSGEFFIILGAFKAKYWYALGAASILVLGASYTLWMFKRVVFGPAVSYGVLKLKDIDAVEKSIFILYWQGRYFG